MPTIASLAASEATEAQIERLDAICGSLEASARAGGFDSALLVRFHVLLAAMTGNDFLETAVAPLLKSADAVCLAWFGDDVAGRLPALIEGHRALIEAVRTHDADAAREIIAALVEPGRRARQANR